MVHGASEISVSNSGYLMDPVLGRRGITVEQVTFPAGLRNAMLQSGMHASIRYAGHP
jgi:hypothetical protein